MKSKIKHFIIIAGIILRLIVIVIIILAVLWGFYDYPGQNILK